MGAGTACRHAARRRRLALGGLAALLLPSGVAGVPARTHEIVIRGLAYLPPTLVVRRGDRVVWVNQDAFPHTVTAAGAFDSGPIEASRSWRLRTRRVGEFRYVCTLHSNMSGTLRVE